MEVYVAHHGPNQAWFILSATPHVQVWTLNDPRISKELHLGFLC